MGGNYFLKSNHLKSRNCPKNMQKMKRYSRKSTKSWQNQPAVQSQQTQATPTPPSAWCMGGSIPGGCGDGFPPASASMKGYRRPSHQHFLFSWTLSCKGQTPVGATKRLGESFLYLVPADRVEGLLQVQKATWHPNCPLPIKQRLYDKRGAVD